MKYYDIFREPGYHSTLFTSFEFAADLFDNVIWPGLISAGSRNVAVIADQDRVNEYFSEFGPSRRAGQSYHLAKRKVVGFFHPKIVIQIGKEQGRLLVGSSNLTSGGLAGNMEAFAGVVVNKDTMWAVPLFASALQYFKENCAPDDIAMKHSIAKALQEAHWLQSANAENEVVDPEGHRHAFIADQEHASVAEQFVAFIDGDTIQRLVIVSPFWGGGLTGVARLGDSLGKPETALVVDPNYQDFDIESLSLPTGTTLHSIDGHPKRANRRLHAKLVIACGKRADYVLTGSANATVQGLYGRRHGAGNAEACVARTEPPGTALQRLDLLDCLAEELSQAELQPTFSAEAEEAQAKIALRDGGSLTLDDALLIWSPPNGCTPMTCQIVIEGRANRVIEEVRPRWSGSRWQVELSSVDKHPLRGRIRFSSGEESELVPIASLDALARIRQSPVSRQYQKLLDALRDQDDFGSEALDLALEIRSMYAVKHQPSALPSRRYPRDADDRDKAQSARFSILTEDEFNDLSDDMRSLLESDVRHGPLGDAHRYINTILGLGLDEIIAPEGEEAELSDLNSTNDDEPQDKEGEGKNDRSGGEDEDSNKGSDNDDGNTPPQPDGANKPKKSRGARDRRSGNPRKLEERLATRIEKLRREILETAKDPMALETAMIFRLAILAIISEAAPACSKPLLSFPMPALSSRTGGGWIRLLGRFLDAIVSRWNLDRFSLHPPNTEQLQCMGAMIFGSSLIRETAIAVGMPIGVQKKFSNLNVNIARSVATVVDGRPDTNQRLEHAMERYDEWRQKSEVKYQQDLKKSSKKFNAA